MGKSFKHEENGTNLKLGILILPGNSTFAQDVKTLTLIKHKLHHFLVVQSTPILCCQNETSEQAMGERGVPPCPTWLTPQSYEVLL